MKLLSILALILISWACEMENSKPTTKEVERSMNQPSKSMIVLKSEVVQNGDTMAYRELSIAYLDEPFPEEVLLYALIMANKYDYLQAHYDVFSCLTNIYLSDISQMDENTASLAINYLLRAYRKGHHQAKDIVEEYEITSSENSKQQIERLFED